jgi:hypothetical protein
VSNNPFDGNDDSFRVLLDGIEQHSRWLAASMFQPASGAGCVSGLHRMNLTDKRAEESRQRLAEDRG